MELRNILKPSEKGAIDGKCPTFGSGAQQKERFRLVYGGVSIFVDVRST
jgi:hypothetical protein